MVIPVLTLTYCINKHGFTFHYCCELEDGLEICIARGNFFKTFHSVAFDTVQALARKKKAIVVFVSDILALCDMSSDEME